MKYKVGDRVRIKSLDWYNDNKDSFGSVPIADKKPKFTYAMSKYCGQVLTVDDHTEYEGEYYMIEDDGRYVWADEMIEGLVEEENVLNKWTGLKVELELSKSVIGVSNVESLHGERFMSGFVKAIIPPDGYIFKDDNGNVINATKIVLEKKKKEYPKTYEECCKILDWNHRDYDRVGYKSELLCKLQVLLLCRDAYWKIAGEEMDLGKPWKPTDSDYITGRYCIFVHMGNIICDTPAQDCILTFPTAEMRDNFYENFKELIEICKELL